MLASNAPPGRVQDAETHASTEERSGAFPPILAYVNAAGSARRLIPQAAAMAAALDAPLTLLHVIDVPVHAGTPADPVEWNLRRQDAGDRVRRAVREHGAHADRTDVRVVEGKPAEQVCRCARELEAGMMVVDIGREEEGAAWEVGDTARKLVDRATGALLLVPTTLEPQPTVSYRRLLVALDGSPRAESVLPLVMRLAQSTGAEIVLAHITPAPELTETGPLDAEDHELRKQLSARNARVARSYIDRIGARLTEAGLAVRRRIVENGDVRSSLAALAAEEAADLVVLSAHGRSNRPDVACGSVAAYMMSHVKTPLLLVMGEHPANHTHMWRNATRRPGDRPVS